MLEGIERLLPDWYEEHARILPWRGDANPYHIWVSEIMLQQTRVEAVKDYYLRFMAQLPDIPSLASASEELLLKLWEGLGYYSRVRNLKKGAIYLCELHHAKMPSAYEELIKVPGIGPYTAGAIASMAFGKPVAAVDGNVLRVWSRLTEDYGDISRQATKKSVTAQVEEALARLSPRHTPGDFNQALMDLGSGICLGNGKPLCGECPLETICRARMAGTQEELPVKPSKKPRKIEEKTVFLLECEGRYAIRKRSAQGLLAGMWEFPALAGRMTAGEVEKMMEGLGVEGKPEYLGDAVHIFSHIEWHMSGYRLHLGTLPEKDSADMKSSTKDTIESGADSETDAAGMLRGVIWKTPEEIAKDYSIPTAFQKYRLHM